MSKVELCKDGLATFTDHSLRNRKTSPLIHGIELCAKQVETDLLFIRRLLGCPFGKAALAHQGLTQHQPSTMNPGLHGLRSNVEGFPHFIKRKLQHFLQHQGDTEILRQLQNGLVDRLG